VKALVAPLLVLLAVAAFLLAVARGAGISAWAVSEGYSATRVEGGRFPKQLVSNGGRLTVPEPPRRIASLTVTADELLTALVGPERVIAVTGFADDPTIEISSQRAPRAATRIRGVDPEHTIALEPDLVFVAHYTLDSAVRILDSAAIPVVRLGETRSFDDVARNVRVAAAAVGEEARGEALLAEARLRLERIQERTRSLRPPRVLYYSAVDYTSGALTLLDEKIRLAGGRNVAAEAGLVGFRNVAVDVLVGMDPDVIVVPAWTSDRDAPVRDVVEAPAWRGVRAVREHRVYSLTAGALTSESPDGVLGVEQLARLLHPEVFPS
jgi:iron complex transport system substrate-binding protein